MQSRKKAAIQRRREQQERAERAQKMERQLAAMGFSPEDFAPGPSVVEEVQ